MSTAPVWLLVGSLILLLRAQLLHGSLWDHWSFSCEHSSCLAPCGITDPSLVSTAPAWLLEGSFSGLASTAPVWLLVGSLNLLWTCEHSSCLAPCGTTDPSLELRAQLLSGSLWDHWTFSTLASTALVWLLVGSLILLLRAQLRLAPWELVTLMKKALIQWRLLPLDRWLLSLGTCGELKSKLQNGKIHDDLHVSGLKLNFFNHLPWGPVSLKIYWPAKYSTVPLFPNCGLVAWLRLSVMTAACCQQQRQSLICLPADSDIHWCLPA